MWVLLLNLFSVQPGYICINIFGCTRPLALLEVNEQDCLMAMLQFYRILAAIWWRTLTCQVCKCNHQNQIFLCDYFIHKSISIFQKIYNIMYEMRDRILSISPASAHSCRINSWVQNSTILPGRNTKQQQQQHCLHSQRWVQSWVSVSSKEYTGRSIPVIVSTPLWVQHENQNYISPVRYIYQQQQQANYTPHTHPHTHTYTHSLEGAICSEVWHQLDNTSVCLCVCLALSLHKQVSPVVHPLCLIEL